MISLKHLIALFIGIAATLIPVSVLVIWYRIRYWKAPMIVLIMASVATAGTYLMYFVENLQFAGTSFYGAVFLIPLAAVWVSRWIHLSYGELTGICTPAVCLMLAIMKFKCHLDNCCRGRVLYVDAQGNSVIFPSQLVEMVVALILLVIVMIIAYRKKNAPFLYPLYMVSYGVIRFILNFFREIPSDRVFIPFGHIWSILSIIIGIIWLIRLHPAEKLSDNVSGNVIEKN